ncbi:MAG: phosphohydrolase [Deltaproteobacteria bacterium]|nr:MAG: phosphohydrolase [Deltaproteobacteria bacterium]
MSKTLCPGQDMRFWRPGDIFDVTCANCGAQVEFFKDEGRRKCSKCGNMVTNPRLSLGCAQWCEHAAECLGYDPKQVESDADDEALVDRLVAGLKQARGRDNGLVERAFARLHQAKELMPDHPGADPKLVMAAALLAELHDPAGAGDRLRAREIMSQAGMDKPSIDEVELLLDGLRAHAADDRPELALLKRAGASLAAR